MLALISRRQRLCPSRTAAISDLSSGKNISLRARSLLRKNISLRTWSLLILVKAYALTRPAYPRHIRQRANSKCRRMRGILTAQLPIFARHLDRLCPWRLPRPPASSSVICCAMYAAACGDERATDKRRLVPNHSRYDGLSRISTRLPASSAEQGHLRTKRAPLLTIPAVIMVTPPLSADDGSSPK